MNIKRPTPPKNEIPPAFRRLRLSCPVAREHLDAWERGEYPSWTDALAGLAFALSRELSRR